MTRPMPGPPASVHYPNYYPHKHPDDAFGLCPGCDIDDQGRYTTSAKRLTDAECAAEYWRAGWIADHDFHDEHEADEASTWHRFATHPHAFKETHA